MAKLKVKDGAPKWVMEWLKHPVAVSEDTWDELKKWTYWEEDS